MQVRIHDIAKSPGLSKPFQAEESMALPGIRLQGPVTVDVRVSNAGTRFVVQGQVKAGAVIECSRCLSDYVEDLDVRVDEDFLREDSPELDNDGVDNILTYKDDRLELDELIRQELMAALPMQPICKDDCKGLCDQCGTDLNEKDCECPTEEVDPRWAGLEKFRQAQSSN